MNDILSNIYYSARNPSSFSGVDKLFREAKSRISTIKREDVKKWLSGELVYSLHKPIKKRFKRNPIIVEKINENFQADLVDMKEFSKINGGYNFILTVIDVFSKRAWAVPLKNKTSRAVTDGMEIVLKEAKPIKLQTDRGKEFENKDFKNLMKKYNINHFTTKNVDIKCAVIERFNRTLKNKMFKYFTRTGKRKYIDILPQLINSYNDTYHRTIKMAPNQVKTSEEKKIFKNIYGYENKRAILKKFKKPLLKTGDDVRKKYDMKILDRGYYPNWTDQTYKIDKSIKNVEKPLYKIKSSTGQLLERRFYPEEIQKINKNSSDIYRVEKILKEKYIKGKKYFLVKWLNHSESENSWEPADNIFDING